MLNIKDLKKIIKNKTELKGKCIKIALLADSASQFLALAIEGYLIHEGINAEIYEADYNQIELQLLNPLSTLHEFEPDYVIIFHSTHKLLSLYNKSSLEERQSFAANRISFIQQLINHTAVPVIYMNYAEIDDNVFGSFANKVAHSFLFQQRELNYLLAQEAVTEKKLYICDVATIQNNIGKPNMFDAPIYVNTDMVLSMDAASLVGEKVVQIIASLQGKIKKCLILDLDNTLWGGIIGDDGVENIQIGYGLGIGKAFTEFQYWIKKLKERGIILAVCSKNDEAVAKKPFEEHPDMVLRLSDIAVFVANWETKVENIKFIQSVLNIGFDSMVFLDDNPFERTIVKTHIPEITVPELPEDPALYLEYLYTLNLFETTSFDKNDEERTKQYQTEAKRSSALNEFVDEASFLDSLNMIAQVAPFNQFNLPRVAQLSQRSNQFNLRTIRYSEEDVQKLSNQQGVYTLTFGLEDKFGDNGLICVVVLRHENPDELFIESWFMSCRVLKRSMENFVLNEILDIAAQLQVSTVRAEYIPTAKNGIVKEHYNKLGFEVIKELDNATQYQLAVKPENYKTTHINKYKE